VMYDLIIQSNCIYVCVCVCVLYKSE